MQTIDRIGTLQEDVGEKIKIKIMFHFFDTAFNFFPCLLVASPKPFAINCVHKPFCVECLNEIEDKEALSHFQC